MIAMLGFEFEFVSEERLEGHTKDIKTKQNRKKMKKSEESERHTRNLDSCNGTLVTIQINNAPYCCSSTCYVPLLFSSLLNQNRR